MDLTAELLQGFDAGTQSRAAGGGIFDNPYYATSDAANAWDIGFFLGSRRGVAFHPRPIAASRGRGNTRVRVKFRPTDAVNIERVPLSGVVYERINATTIRRV